MSLIEWTAVQLMKAVCWHCHGHDKWLEDTSKAFTGRVIEFRFALNVGSNYYTYLWHALICVIMCMAGVSNLFDTKFHLYVQYVYVCMAIVCSCILHVPFSCNIVMFCFILFGAVLFEYHWDTVVVLSIFEIIFIILCFVIFVSFSSFFFKCLWICIVIYLALV